MDDELLGRALKEGGALGRPKSHRLWRSNYAADQPRCNDYEVQLFPVLVEGAGNAELYVELEDGR